MSQKHTEMSSREIITRVIEHKDAPRIGFDFLDPHEKDILQLSLNLFRHPQPQYNLFGHYQEVLDKVPWFQGEVRVDSIGNILGRFEGKTKGECILGVLQKDWKDLDSFEFPEFDESYMNQIKAASYGATDKFFTVYPPVAVFSTLRDARLMDNALADTLMEPEAVQFFLEKVEKVLLKSVNFACEIGAQGMWLLDDWGTQQGPFISPDSFRELFKPVYKNVADALHERGMKLILHSCGLVWKLMPDMIDAGIDVFQFDQPELSGSENLAKTFGKKLTMYSSVDIQKVMATGDRQAIEATAHQMIQAFKAYADGALIARDYPAWDDINVEPEWADWARNVFLEEGWYR